MTGIQMSTSRPSNFGASISYYKIFRAGRQLSRRLRWVAHPRLIRTRWRYLTNDRAGGPPFLDLAFVVPTIHGAPSRMIPLDHSSDSCSSLCGCPVLRRLCEGWVVSVSVLVPPFTSNPSIYPAYTNSLPLTKSELLHGRSSFSASKAGQPLPTLRKPSEGWGTQKLRLNFVVICSSGIIRTEAPSFVETTDTMRPRVGHPPRRPLSS